MSEQVKTYAFSELLNHPRKPDQDAIIGEGILKKNSLMVIGGPPKSYKSFISNTIAIDLVVGRHLFTATRSEHGRHYHAFDVRAPQRVLIFEQEIGEDDIEDRLKPIFDILDPHQQQLVGTNLFTHSLDHRLQLDTPEGLNLLAKEIEAINPTVVIFDPLIEFHTSDENNTQQMAKVMRHIDLLRENYKFATIMNHHEGKETTIKRSGGDRLRGNSVIYGKGDTFLTLRVISRDSSIIGCEFTVRRGKPIHPFMLKLSPITMRADFFDWGKNPKSSERKDKQQIPIQ